MENCSHHCASSCPLPNDLRIAIKGASLPLGAAAAQPVNVEGCCQAVMSALGPDSVISIELDEVRSLIGQGYLSLGYGQAPTDTGNIIQACKASVHGLLTENPDLLQTATGVLVIIRTPQNAAVKLSEIRTGLREIWQHSPDSAQRLYSCIASEATTGRHEVYTLVVNDNHSRAIDQQLAANRYLTLDAALLKISRLLDQTESEAILLRRACRMLTKHQRCSTSLIQRKLRLGHSRTSNLMAQLEREGIVGSISSNGLRQVLVRF